MERAWRLLLCLGSFAFPADRVLSHYCGSAAQVEGELAKTMPETPLLVRENRKTSIKFTRKVGKNCAAT